MNERGWESDGGVEGGERSDESGGSGGGDR